MGKKMKNLTIIKHSLKNLNQNAKLTLTLSLDLIY